MVNSYSKMKMGHKCKDKDVYKDNDKDKGNDKDNRIIETLGAYLKFVFFFYRNKIFGE